MKYWAKVNSRSPHSAGANRAIDTTTTGASDVLFEVSEDEVDGGYTASALGYGIHTQGDTVEEIRRNVKEAADCYFDDTMPRPKLIRLHFVRDEILLV